MPLRRLSTHLALLCLLLTGCEKPPAPPPPAATVVVTTGIIDWSGWQKWIQSPPRLILVDNLDPETRRLIAEQTRLFKILVAEPKATTPVPDKAQQLETWKTDFLNTAYNQQTLAYASGSDNTTTYYSETGGVLVRTRTSNINVPHFDRWDRYRRALQALQPSNLATTLVTLERQARNDQQDLAPLRNSTGVIGLQARADTEWLNHTLQPLIEKLKTLETPAPAAAPVGVEQARREWQNFEANELALIKRVITERTQAQASAAADGAFSIPGQGQLYALVTVAGRDLYFPATARDLGLRFVNVRTETQPATP